MGSIKTSTFDTKFGAFLNLSFYEIKQNPNLHEPLQGAGVTSNIKERLHTSVCSTNCSFALLNAAAFH